MVASTGSSRTINSPLPEGPAPRSPPEADAGVADLAFVQPTFNVVWRSAISIYLESRAVSKRRGRLAADNCRGLVDQQVILQRGDHE